MRICGIYLNPTLLAKTLKIIAPLIRLQIAVQNRNSSHLARSKGQKCIYIFGWYGTETTGDKAILGAIIQDILRLAPNVRFVVSSYNPDYTKNTLIQLGLTAQVDVISEYTRESLKPIWDSNLVIIGGGPLMEDTTMHHWLRKVIVARLFNKPVMLYGCGVGPVHTSQMGQVIRLIAECANVVALRDNISKETLKSLNVRNKILVTGEPSITFLSRLMRGNQNKLENILLNEVGAGLKPAPSPAGIHTFDRPLVGICVRNWPEQYFDPKSNQSYDAVYRRFKTAIAKATKHLIDRYNAQIIFIPMHTLPGDDDREAAKEIVEMVGCHDSVELLVEERTPQQIFSVFKQLSLFIGMRFHSVVFALAAHIPTIGIDYDMKTGKVYGIMYKINKSFCLNIRNISDKMIIEKIDEIWAKKTLVYQEIKGQMKRVKKQVDNNAKLASKYLC